MQREAPKACGGSELHFETKHNCTENSTMGSMARAGSAAGSGQRRPAAVVTPAREGVIAGGSAPALRPRIEGSDTDGG